MPTSRKSDLPPVALSASSAPQSRGLHLQTLVDALLTPAAFLDAKFAVLAANPTFRRLALQPADGFASPAGKPALVPPLKSALAYSLLEGPLHWSSPCDLQAVRLDSQYWSVRWSRHRLAGKRVLLVQLERQILETETNGRQQLGLELHDNVGQKLTAVSLLAHELRDELAAEHHCAAAIAQRLVDGVRQTFTEVQRIARGAFPPDLSNSELTAALADLAEQTSASADVRCTFDAQGDSFVFPEGSAIHLYRIAQEAVSNAVRHAAARTITIRLQASDFATTLTIADDGVGISAKPKTTGVGLRTMRRRAALLGGRLQLQSLLPTGTKVTCTAPRETPQ